MFKPLAGILLTLAASLALPAGPSALRAEPEAPLVIADPRGDRGLLAPFAHRRDGMGYIYTGFLFDTLVEKDETGAFVPGLALHWQASGDGLVYDIDLDSSARWQDGHPLTAQDVAFTVDYLRRHRHGFVSVEAIGEAVALDEARLRLRLTRPDAGFVGEVLAGMPVLPAHVYRDIEDPQRFASLEAAAGSGPYRLATFDKAQGRYRLEAVAGHRAGPPRFSTVVITRLAPEAAALALIRGEADIVPNLMPAKAAEVAAAGKLVIETSSGHPVRLLFNHRNPVLAPLAVRRALAHALDRQALVDIAYQGHAQVAEAGYFQKGSRWLRDGGLPGYAFDPQQAERLLTEAGWTRDAAGNWQTEGAPDTLRLVVGEDMRRLAVTLADQFARFGLKVALSVLEQGALQDRLASDEFDLALASTSTLGDPNGIVRRIVGDDWRHDRFPGDQDLRDLLRRQSEALDADERQRILWQFEDLYLAQLPSLMLVDPVWMTGHSPRVVPVMPADGVAIGIPSPLHRSLFYRPGAR